MEKPSQKTVRLDDTKITSLIHYRSAEMSDATRLLRKEEFLKRKLKAMLEVNAGLEKDIKSNETEIRDERSGMSFQLNDLLKELAVKFDYFVEQRLERSGFGSNSTSQSSIQGMMQKYEQIEEESLLLRRVLETLEGISGRYVAHSAEMEELVVSLEAASKDYEEGMDDALQDINQQIKGKLADNQRTEANTQNLIREIDGFVEGTAALREEEMRRVGKIEKLKKMAMRQQEKMNEIREWAEIVIDKNNRQVVYQTLAQKEEDLTKLKSKNDQLEMYLNELEAEERALMRVAAGKENSASSRTRSAAKRKEERVTFRQGR